MRSLDEIQRDVSNAIGISDASVLLQLTEELEGIDSPNARATQFGARGYAALCVGDYLHALDLLQKAYTMNEAIGNTNGMIGVMGNIGNVHLKVGDYPAAMQCFQNALAAFRSLDNRAGEALSLLHIADTYAKFGEHEKALDHYRQAQFVFEALNDRLGAARAMCGIAGLQRGPADDAKQLDYYRRALAIMEEHSNHQNSIALRLNIAVRLSNMGELADARSIVESIDENKITDPALLYKKYDILSALCELEGDIPTSLELIHKALAIAKENGLQLEMTEAHAILRDFALAQNNLQEYITHNDASVKINEAILGKQAAIKLATQEKDREFAEREAEHQRYLAVLHSTLPKHIADRVARGETVNDHIDNSAVMFLDIVGFTTLSSTLTSQQVITLLDALFGICDEACLAHNVTRVKTIGDSYMAVAFGEIAGCEQQIANAALDIIGNIKEFDFKSLLSLQVPSITSSPYKSLQVRIGLHCGPVTAGVLGKERLQYDVWGDTVNVASRMESTGEPNRIHVSLAFKEALEIDIPKNEGNSDVARGTWHMALRGETEIKGKGMMQTYWLERA